MHGPLQILLTLRIAKQCRIVGLETVLATDPVQNAGHQPLLLLQVLYAVPLRLYRHRCLYHLLLHLLDLPPQHPIFLAQLLHLALGLVLQVRYLLVKLRHCVVLQLQLVLQVG